MDRIEKLAKLMREQGLDGLLLSKDANIRYLTGFTGSESYTLISPQGQVFITDSRYVEQAEQECKDFEVVKWRSPYPDLPETLQSVCARLGVKKLGFEKNCVTVELYEKLKEGLADIKLVGTSGLTEKIRMVKDEQEIALMRKAARIADEAFSEILNYIRPGIREKDIERELQYAIKKKGAEIGFSTIVASGKNSSMPHAIPSDKPVEAGDLITIDLGALYEGYKSDMTRTIVVERISDRQKEVYEIVKLALEEATKTVKAGVSGKVPDRRAREIIEQREIEGIFQYGVGHGVGLEIHESPFLSSKCDLALEAGNVVTIEPGIYIPGWGGIRIEDTMVVGVDGSEILTKASKELIVV